MGWTVWSSLPGVQSTVVKGRGCTWRNTENIPHSSSAYHPSGGTPLCFGLMPPTLSQIVKSQSVRIKEKRTVVFLLFLAIVRSWCQDLLLWVFCTQRIVQMDAVKLMLKSLQVVLAILFMQICSIFLHLLHYGLCKVQMSHVSHLNGPDSEFLSINRFGLSLDLCKGESVCSPKLG